MGICRYCGGETEGRSLYDSELCRNLYWMRYKENDLAIPGKRPTAMGAWEYIRSWAIAFSRGRCEACGKDRRELFDELLDEEGRDGRWLSPNFFNSFNPFEVHHIVPIQMGGNSSLDNLIVLCRKCHLEAHAEIRISESLLEKNQSVLDEFEEWV